MPMNHNKKSLTPRWRFRQDSADWIVEKFDFEFLQTNTFCRADMNSQHGKVKNIHYGDILTKYNDILYDFSSVPFINEDINLSKFNGTSYLKDGDVVIADTAEDLTAGKAVEVLNINTPLLAGQHTFLCRPKKNFALGFMGYYLNSPTYRKQIVPLLAGAKVYSISKSSIKDTLILYPYNLEEQQKIADCLASLDELITAENKKLDALKKHKQALMQNLFPARGKTMPAWRFAQFQNDGEWEKEQLKDVCSYFSSSLTTNDITKDGLYDLYDANKLIGKTATYASDKEYIAIIKDGSGVGRIRLMKGYTNVVGTMGILTNKPVVDIQYLYYLLQTINFPIYKIGGAIPHIYFKDYSQATIFRPEKNEQEKIAECLSTADQLIQDQAHKLETLKMHKKALMQGLFPTLEDIK